MTSNVDTCYMYKPYHAINPVQKRAVNIHTSVSLKGAEILPYVTDI